MKKRRGNKLRVFISFKNRVHDKKFSSLVFFFLLVTHAKKKDGRHKYKLITLHDVNKDEEEPRPWSPPMLMKDEN